MIVAATTLIMETYRCTELQQIPGSELDDDDGDDDGAPDYIWLPVSDACLSFFTMTPTSHTHSPI